MSLDRIYKELGPGKRISLAKLSVEHLENSGRRFRLAIDISIWQFQIQSSDGGRNPALRTLYYRLLKLLSLGIYPLFVFDGPYKPKVKRNVKTTIQTACLDNYLAKQLLTIFKFPFHDAPGEAEAECALLQKEGIVDAVLSEDVDTLMFGCTLSLRSWTAEGARSGKTPTHVSAYTAKANHQNAGLDSHGMILVALMSGGDYNTEGVQGCGPKIACEAARAGFGLELCQLAQNDPKILTEWRMRLQNELHTNQSRYFKQKHKSLILPVGFPDHTILNYYIRPAVSSMEMIGRLRKSIKWNGDIDSVQLRNFVAEAFNWTYLMGAKQFIRAFAPALLAHKLLERNSGDNSDHNNDDLKNKASAEAELISIIHGKRTHWNTDGCQELRVSYIPSHIVGLNLSLEEDFDHAGDLGVPNEDNEKDSGSEESKGLKSRGASTYDPSEPEKIWILETFLKLGIPLLVETWEEEMRDPKKFAIRKARAAPSKFNNNTSKGAMDRFVRVTKPHPEQGKPEANTTKFLSKETDAAACVIPFEVVDANREGNNLSRTKKSKGAQKVPSFASTKRDNVQRMTSTPPSTTNTNPWTLSKRPTDTYNFKTSSRYSALGIYASDDPESLEPRFRRPYQSNHTTLITQGQSVLFTGQKANSSRSKHTREASTSLAPGSDESVQQLNNVTYRTPRRLENAKPSPKKRRTPVKDFDARLMPTTQCILRQGPELIDLDSEAEGARKKHFVTPRVNRKLEFSNIVKSPQHDAAAASPPSDHSSLPSPSSLYRRPKEPLKIGISSSRSHNVSANFKSLHNPSNSTEDHAFISLRESLEGSWKHILPWQADSTKDVFTDVEVLDLTRNE